jgi:hypothetical protein
LLAALREHLEGALARRVAGAVGDHAWDDLGRGVQRHLTTNALQGTGFSVIEMAIPDIAL